MIFSLVLYYSNIIANKIKLGKNRPHTPKSEFFLLEGPSDVSVSELDKLFAFLLQKCFRSSGPKFR